VDELLGLLKESRLFLGNDSGATHLAAALGVPTLAVFGPSDPWLWRPLGPRVRVVTSRRLCAPCTAGGPIACSSRSCLEELDAREIAKAALRLLEG
jgi:ADP-heptose:LPS heptosyltransferase